MFRIRFFFSFNISVWLRACVGCVQTRSYRMESTQSEKTYRRFVEIILHSLTININKNEEPTTTKQQIININRTRATDITDSDCCERSGQRTTAWPLYIYLLLLLKTTHCGQNKMIHSDFDDDTNSYAEHRTPHAQHTHTTNVVVRWYVQVVSEPAQVHDRLVCSILRILHRTRYELRGTGNGETKEKWNRGEGGTIHCRYRSFDVIKVNYTNNIWYAVTFIR